MAERVIEKRTYRYDRQTGEDGLRLLLRVLKLVVPAQALIEAVATEDGDAEGPALIACLSAMDDKAVADLVIGLVSQCREDGRLIENTYGLFSPELMMRIALFALQTEFGSFFREGAGSVIRRAVRGAA